MFKVVIFFYRVRIILNKNKLMMKKNLCVMINLLIMEKIIMVKLNIF